jgi:hypothetical protein
VTGLELDGLSNNLTVYLMNEPKKEIVLDPNDIPGDEFEIPVDLNRANSTSYKCSGTSRLICINKMVNVESYCKKNPEAQAELEAEANWYTRSSCFDGSLIS